MGKTDEVVISFARRQLFCPGKVVHKFKAQLLSRKNGTVSPFIEWALLRQKAERKKVSVKALKMLAQWRS